MLRCRRLPLTLALFVLAAPLHALDILITNDDGLSANVRALYQALRSEGHQVMVSVPCHNQSGQGAALNFLRPVGPLSADCVGGIAHVERLRRTSGFELRGHDVIRRQLQAQAARLCARFHVTRGVQQVRFDQ